MTPLFNRSNVDKQLQPNFPPNELSLAVGTKYIDLYAQAAARQIRRDRLQSAKPEKRYYENSQ